MKGRVLMEKEALLKNIQKFLEEHPQMNWENFTKLIKPAYDEAQQTTIPNYEPIKVKPINPEEGNSFNAKLDTENTSGLDDESLIGNDESL